MTAGLLFKHSKTNIPVTPPFGCPHFFYFQFHIARIVFCSFIFVVSWFTWLLWFSSVCFSSPFFLLQWEQAGKPAATAGLNRLSGHYSQTYALTEPSSPPSPTRPRSLASPRYDNASGTHSLLLTQAKWRQKKRGAAVAMNETRS